MCFHENIDQFFFLSLLCGCHCNHAVVKCTLYLLFLCWSLRVAFCIYDLPSVFSLSLCSYLQDFRLEDVSERNAQQVRNWVDTFLHVGCNSEADKLDHYITLTRNNVKPPGVSSFCRFADAKKLEIVRIAYRRHMLKETFDKYAWVKVSSPFDLKDFSWHLLSSLDPESQRNEDPVEECWEFLHKYHCLVVINGLQSKECWDMIKANLTSGTFRSCIFVITEKESVATHCAASEDALYNINDLPIEKVCYVVESLPSSSFIKSTLRT